MKAIFRPVWALLFGLLFLVSCTVSALPPYDADLVRKVDALNAETLTLFASLEGGSDRSAFPQFKDTYNGLIGKFEAAEDQADVRDVPAFGQRIASSSFFAKVCPAEDPMECLDTTPTGLANIVTVVRKLRDDHKSKGLSGGAVQLARANYDTLISPILEIEAALER